MNIHFTSAFTKKVICLISLQPRTKISFHLSCDGLMKHFNNTLDRTLKIRYAKKQKDWGDYLSTVCRIQGNTTTSSGMLPFELVYERYELDPMFIFKTLWTTEIWDPNVQIAYREVFITSYNPWGICNTLSPVVRFLTNAIDNIIQQCLYQINY